MSFKVLIVAFEKHWLAPLRLPAHFKRLGSHVSVIAHPDSWLSRVRDIDAFYPAPLQSGTVDDLRAIARASTREAPDLIVPGDDLACAALHAMERSRPGSVVTVHDRLRATIRTSLGNAVHYGTLASGLASLQMASSLGIATVGHEVVHNTEQAIESLARYEGRMVLRLDGTVGGGGAFPCLSVDDVHRAFLEIDGFLKRYRIPGRPLLYAQRYIEGYDISCVFSAAEGQVLAGMAFRVLSLFPEGRGNPTRVMPHASAPLTAAVRQFVAAVGLSGFGHLAFKEQPGAAVPLLSHCDARVTALSHLPAFFGIDPIAALSAACGGPAHHPSRPKVMPKRMCLFPQEYWRDPKSPAFDEDTVDGPFSEPILVRALAPAYARSMTAIPSSH